MFEVGFEKEYDIEMLKIGCPHILKIADEYTARVLKQGVSKGGKNRDNIGRVSGESPSRTDKNRIDNNITEKKNDPLSSEKDERLSKTISLKEEKKEQEHRIEQYFNQTKKEGYECGNTHSPKKGKPVFVLPIWYLLKGGETNPETYP